MQLSFVTIFWIQGRGHNNVLISDEAAAASLASWYKWECNDITKHYQLPRSHYLLLSQYQVINWPGLRQSSHCSHQQQGQLQLIEQLQLQLHWRLDSYLLQSYSHCWRAAEGCSMTALSPSLTVGDINLWGCVTCRVTSVLPPVMCDVSHGCHCH